MILMKERFDEIMKQGLKKWRLLSIFTIVTLFLSGCGKPFLSALTPAGEVAREQYNLILLSIGIMTLVLAVVFIIFFIVIFRFRRKEGEEDKIPKQIEGSHILEIVWTTIPIILLVILAIPTVMATFELADTKAMDKKNEDGTTDALVVNVFARVFTGGNLSTQIKKSLRVRILSFQRIKECILI